METEVNVKCLSCGTEFTISAPKDMPLDNFKETPLSDCPHCGESLI